MRDVGTGVPPPSPITARRTPWRWFSRSRSSRKAFVARNSDVWLHLATGRLVAHGDYHFGADPFAYTIADKY
ncbi:hypothetical protein J8F10_07710 [Gemmata sp. G18]|uniref:DUF1559 domain-containing protein n=1 Tax=Gemmata palustris TaxID=2822762 RepID=A0ABS5BN71_9BACT|nr:hypothetical protein [Gemmata palustris]MBP3955165.1 hypothetical protein [Gemmata palustris]